MSFFLTFYKGTTIGEKIDMKEYDKWLKISNEFIKFKLHTGNSITSIKQNIRQKMDDWENDLSKYPVITTEVVKEISNKHNITLIQLLQCWNVYVLILLKLKVIKNDNDNGLLIVRFA